MSKDAETVKKLVALKQRLEKNVGELGSELEEARAMLEAVNSILLEKGFKKAEITKEPASAEALQPKEEKTTELSVPPLSMESENVIPLKAVTGEMLAMLYVHEDSLHVLPAEDKDFDVNTPPFTHFLVERVLTKMQERDSELARTGQVTPEKIFSYNIIREGDVIREIIIKNVDEERLRELRSSIRWTFEKMYEKMEKQPK